MSYEIKLKQFLETTPFKEFSITKVNTGVSTQVYKLSKQYNYYLKIFPKEEKINEAEIQQCTYLKLHEFNISIPEIIYTSSNIQILNNSDIIIETELPGSAIADSKLTLNEITNILINAGIQLATINSVKIKGIGWLSSVNDNELIASFKDYKEFVFNNFQQNLPKLKSDMHLSTKLIDNLNKYVLAYFHIININQTSFLSHGDISLEHIYQKDNQYSGIIDFGDARGTSIYHDLARFYTQYPQYFEYLLKGYQLKQKLTENYMQAIKCEAIIWGLRKLLWYYRNRYSSHKSEIIINMFNRALANDTL